MSDAPTSEPSALMQAAGAATSRAAEDEAAIYDRRKAAIYAEDRLRKQTRALLVGAFVKARALNIASDFEPVDIERLDALELLAANLTKARLGQEEAQS